WLIIDEDIAIRSCVLILLRISGDRRAHLLHHDLPLALADGDNARIVIVIPGGERRGGNRQQCNSDQDLSLHCFVTSFSSSSRLTPPRSMAFGTFWPASICTPNVVFPFGPVSVMRYLPGARSMRVGVDFFSSLRSTGVLFFSFTILSMSPHGDAERSRAPLPGA